MQPESLLSKEGAKHQLCAETLTTSGFKLIMSDRLEENGNLYVVSRAHISVYFWETDVGFFVPKVKKTI